MKIRIAERRTGASVLVHPAQARCECALYKGCDLMWVFDHVMLDLAHRSLQAAREVAQVLARLLVHAPGELLEARAFAHVDIDGDIASTRARTACKERAMQRRAFDDVVQL